MNINPIGLWALVETIKLDLTVGGIALPESTARGDLRLGKVLKIGKPVNPETGKVVPFPFKEGDIIVYTPDAMVIAMQQTAIARHGLIPSNLSFVHSRHIISTIKPQGVKEIRFLDSLLSPTGSKTVLEEDSIEIGANNQIAFAGK